MAALTACAAMQQASPALSKQQTWQQQAAPRHRRRHPRLVMGRATPAEASSSAPFPSDYNQAVRQAQAAVQAALADGEKLLEVEFPTASLAAVAGDAEGAC